MKRKPSQGLIDARLASRTRTESARYDREAAARYRELTPRQSPEVAQDYLERAEECERIAAAKMKGKT